MSDAHNQDICMADLFRAGVFQQQEEQPWQVIECTLFVSLVGCTKKHYSSLYNPSECILLISCPQVLSKRQVVHDSAEQLQ